MLLYFSIKKELQILNKSLHPSTNNTQNTYQSSNTIINVYDALGHIKFKLITNCIQHCSDQKITWLIYPQIIIFDSKNTPTWKITTNRAKLNHKKILYLYEHTYINNLINDAYIQSVTTNQAIINLITQDIVSNEQVIIHGNGFYSIGMKMRANLRTQTVKLTNNAETHYDIQHIW